MSWVAIARPDVDDFEAIERSIFGVPEPGHHALAGPWGVRLYFRDVITLWARPAPAPRERALVLISARAWCALRSESIDYFHVKSGSGSIRDTGAKLDQRNDGLRCLGLDEPLGLRVDDLERDQPEVRHQPRRHHLATAVTTQACPATGYRARRAWAGSVTA